MDGLIDFLVKDKGFKFVQRCAQLPHINTLHSEDRVRKGAEKLTKFLNAKQQGRLDGFFTVQSKASPEASKDAKGKGKAKDNNGRKRRVGGQHLSF